MGGSEKWIQVWFVTVWPAAKGRAFKVTDDINILFACSEDPWAASAHYCKNSIEVYSFAPRRFEVVCAFDGSWARRRFKIAIRNQYTYDGTSTEMASMIPPKSPIITESGQRYTIILRAVGHVAQLFLQIQDFQEACGRRMLERRGELTYTRCTRLGGAIGFRPQVPLRFGVAVVDGRLRHGET